MGGCATQKLAAGGLLWSRLFLYRDTDQQIIAAKAIRAYVRFFFVFLLLFSLCFDF